jgi:hypothetical protein
MCEGGDFLKHLFKIKLENTLKSLQKDFAKVYKDDSNEGLSIYMDKNGYITAFSMDSEGKRIPELNILITKEEEE